MHEPNLYIAQNFVDTHLSPRKQVNFINVPEVIYSTNVDSHLCTNVLSNIATVQAPNGPQSYNHMAYHTEPCSSSNLHSYTERHSRVHIPSTASLNRVNRKFIQDRLLPKRVSNYFWSDVIANKPCNNISNNNNTDFLIPENLVLNLSQHQLTDNQISIISRGLSFCPTPGEPDMGQLFLDLERLFRKMRLTLFWAEDQPQNSSVSNTQNMYTQNTAQIEPYHSKLFIEKSTFDPVHLNQGLEPFQKAVKNTISTQPIRAPMTKNVSSEEIEALKQLSTNQDIVIKKSDKGSCICIQNKTSYIQECMSQLNNTTVYKRETENLTSLFNTKIHTLIDEIYNKGSISIQVANYLKIVKPRTPLFYTLPKIHKNIRPPPGRPILSANDSPTERISAFVDHFLQMYVPLMDSYLKDTTHHIRKVESTGTLPPHTLLVTLDVKSLYTNIPQWEGLSVIHKLLNKKRPGNVLPTNQDILRLLQLVLTLNHFEFNDTYWTQISGVAMGSKSSPTFSNLFMEDWEEKWVYTYPLQPLVWRRYIDDVFMIWTHNIVELKKFIDHLNSVHPTIKFTAEWSETEINFLDTTVKVSEERKLYTTLYTKPTDTHTYLHFLSAHPMHQKKCGPYSQLVRVRRICTKFEDFLTNAKKILAYYKARGYPETLLNEALDRASALDRTVLLIIKETPLDEDSSELILVLTHNPANPEVKKTLTDNWHLIKQERSLAPLHDSTVKMGFRRPPNLQDLLVKARVNGPTVSKHQISGKINNPCFYTSNIVCRYCPKMDRCGTIKSNVTGRTYTTPQGGSCGSNNLIYLVTCTKCSKQYVGETSNSLNQRFYQHLYENKHLKDPLNAPPSMVDKIPNPLPKHFAQADHTHLDMKVQIVEYVKLPPKAQTTTVFRRKRELHWIHQLKTFIPQGINSMNVARWLIARK